MPSRMPSLHGCIRISFKFDLMRSLSCYMRRAYCLICLQSSPWLPSDATMTPSITTSLQKPMERSICVAHSMPTRPSSKKETSSRSFASSTLNDMNIHVPNSTKTIQNASASNERFAKTTTSTISNARQDGLLARLRMLALNDDRRHDDAEPHRARNGHRHDLAPLRRQNVDLIPALERLKRPYCSQTTHQYADDGA